MMCFFHPSPTWPSVPCFTSTSCLLNLNTLVQTLQKSTKLSGFDSIQKVSVATGLVLVLWRHFNLYYIITTFLGEPWPGWLTVFRYLLEMLLSTFLPHIIYTTICADKPGLCHHGWCLIEQLGLVVRIEGSGIGHVVQNIAADQPVPDDTEMKHQIKIHNAITGLLSEEVKRSTDSWLTSQLQRGASLVWRFPLCLCTWLYLLHLPDRWAAADTKLWRVLYCIHRKKIMYWL